MMLGGGASVNLCIDNRDHHLHAPSSCHMSQPIRGAYLKRIMRASQNVDLLDEFKMPKYIRGPYSVVSGYFEQVLRNTHARIQVIRLQPTTQHN